MSRVHGRSLRKTLARRAAATVRRRRRRLRNYRFPGPDDRSADSLDVRMMRRAILLAQRAAAVDEVPVGAVVYRGEEVVAEAFNIRESAADPVGHAELLAIRQAAHALGRWRLSDCSLAVTLEPCPMCAGALVNARLERLVYGADDPKAGACRSLFRIPTDARLNHRVEIVAGVLAQECSRLLTQFFQAKRRNRSDTVRSRRIA